ncbi:hypothetical protein PQX77_002849, partial [Marasmius sp. AFHP31]
FMDDNKAVEEINEHHVGGWTEMIQNSSPPISNTPLSAYMDQYALEKRIVGLDNTKVKEILAYQFRHPDFGHDIIKAIVDKWKEEGSWPVLQ